MALVSAHSPWPTPNAVRLMVVLPLINALVSVRVSLGKGQNYW